MDKNTLWGLLCMAAIFFGFMYCNRPSQEQLEAQRAAQAAKTTGEGAAAADDAVAVDSLSPALNASLAEAVRTIGAAREGGQYVLSDGTFELRLDSTELTGTVAVGTNKVDVAALRTTSGAAVAPDLRAAAIKAIAQLTSKSQKYKGFARHLGGENTVTTLENELMKVSISSRGGMVSAVELKKYNTEVGETPEPIQLFRGSNDGYSFTFTTSDQRLDTREFNFTPVVESDTSVMMVLDLADGAQWGIRYTLHPQNYLVGMEIVQKGMGAVLPGSTASADFNWHQTMARNEKGRVFEERNSAIYYKYVGESPDDLSEQKDDSEQLNGRVKWVAFKNQFFSSVIIARNHFSGADLKSTVLKSDEYLKDMTMSATLPYTVADGAVAAFDFYFGPNDYPLLSKLDKQISPEEDLDLTRLIPLGWGLFRYINTWIVIPVFTFLSSFISNYGIIILLLTIFIKLIIFPFTYKSYKSQARMRVLQPEIKDIHVRHLCGQNLDTVYLHNLAHHVAHGVVRQLAFQLLILGVQSLDLPEEGLDPVAKLPGSGLGRLCRVMELPLHILVVGHQPLPCQGLDPADPSRDAGLGQDLKRRDHPCGAYMGSSAQFHREISHLHHPDSVPVLFAKQSHGAGLFGLVQGHLLGDHSQIFPNLLIDQILHLFDLVLCHGGEMGKVKS